MNRTGIEYQAERAATEHYVNEDIKKGFVRGAVWAVDQLNRMIEPSCYEPMMDKSTKKMVKELDLATVNRFVKDMLTYQEEVLAALEEKGE